MDPSCLFSIPCLRLRHCSALPVAGPAPVVRPVEAPYCLSPRVRNPIIGLLPASCKKENTSHPYENRSETPCLNHRDKYCSGEGVLRLTPNPLTCKPQADPEQD